MGLKSQVEKKAPIVNNVYIMILSKKGKKEKERRKEIR